MCLVCTSSPAKLVQHTVGTNPQLSVLERNLSKDDDDHSTSGTNMIYPLTLPKR